MNFQTIRRYYIRRAKNEGDVKEEIRLLEESRRLENDKYHAARDYSERLIELYHMDNNFPAEKAERKSYFMNSHLATLEDFRAYRAMCSKEEWEKERVELINAHNYSVERYELLAEEQMLPELFAAISEKKDRLELWNKYGFLLAEDYPEPILRDYSEFVTSLATSARNRANYTTLIQYLKRMQQYEGGPEIVQKLCKTWISQYPTRKLMVQELQKMLHQTGPEYEQQELQDLL